MKTIITQKKEFGMNGQSKVFTCHNCKKPFENVNDGFHFDFILSEFVALHFKCWESLYVNLKELGLI